MAKKLKDIEISEISLVTSTASRKKFVILKRRKSMDELIEQMKTFLGEDAMTKKVIEKMKELPDKKVEEFKKSLDDLEPYRENFPTSVGEAVNTLLKSASFEYPEIKTVEGLDVEDIIEKKGASFSKATVEQLKKIVDIITKLIGEKTQKGKDGKELSSDVQAQLDELVVLKRAEKERKEKEELKKEEKAEERIKGLEAEIEKIKETKGIKKSIDGQDNDDDAGDDDEEEDKYPSIPIPTKQ